MRTPLLVVTSLLLWLACGDFSPTPAPENLRTVTLRIQPPSPFEMGPGQSANRPSLQLAAMRIENGQIVQDSVVVGLPQDVLNTQSEDITDRPLSVAIPRDQSLVIFVQTPKNGLRALGRMILRLEMANELGSTSRVPAGQGDLDLGTIPLAGTGFDFNRVHDVRIAKDHNPWVGVKVTSDGSQELSDLRDDDGNGTPDDLE